MKIRNYNLDFLRMVTMFMIVTHHLLVHGGVLNAVSPGSTNYYVVWFIEAIVICAVNCYGILSGYVGIHRKYRYTNLIILWLQVFIYSVSITLILILQKKLELNSEILKSSFFPIIHGQYWYFTAYAGLFFITPILNAALKNITPQQAKALLITVSVFYCLLPTLFRLDTFTLGNGYSFAWLFLLYIIGGCLNICESNFSRNSWQWGIGYLLSIIIAWFFKLFVEYRSLNFLNPNLLMSYTAPTIVISAVCLFLMFKQMTIHPFISKLVQILSPTSFGIYLIHDNKKIRQFFISGITTPLSTSNTTEMLLKVLFIAAKIYCICIDLLRHYIFKVLKLREHLLNLESKISQNLW